MAGAADHQSTGGDGTLAQHHCAGKALAVMLNVVAEVGGGYGGEGAIADAPSDTLRARGRTARHTHAHSTACAAGRQ